ncbi:MAG TPA: hypothetical protein VGH80_02505 [Xanthomonadaceae bacterium]|jgi:Ax21 family sulfation-dependent quorum factor
MKRLLLAALATAILPLAAQAGDLSYSYLQADYGYSHNDNNGGNGHSWNGTASAAIGQNFQLFGGGSVSERDASSNSGQGWNIGGGFHTPISSQTDFVGTLDYRHANIDGVSGDVKAYTGAVGVRSGLTPHVEGWVMAGYSDNHNDLGDISRDSKGRAFGELGGQYKFNKNWGLVATGRLSSDDHSFTVGPRFSF